MLLISDGIAGRLSQTSQLGTVKPDPTLFDQTVARAKPEVDDLAATHRPTCSAGPHGVPGDNHFEYHTEGPGSNLAVGGSHDEREHQRDVTLALAGPAGASYLTGQVSVVPRFPSDSQVQDTLSKLDRNPPIGQDGEEVTRTTYSSHIPNASAEEAYRHFVEQPKEVFGAGGMEIRPPAGALENNGRYMLESGGPPPVWLPVEITLDPANHALTIHTLDGHPLRGEQTFTFEDDGHGGTNLTQEARYQASSNLVGDLQQIASISEGQHSAWKHAHQEIYREFNCDPGYKGIGTSAFGPELIKADLDLASNVVFHPMKAAGALVGATGVGANSVIDQAGAKIGSDLDRLGIPGGGVIKDGFDVAGDGVEVVADVTRRILTWRP